MFKSYLKRVYDYYVGKLSKKYAKQSTETMVYLLSFPNNDRGLIEALHEENDLKVCYTKACQKEAKALEQQGVTVVPLFGLKSFKKSIKLMTQSRVIVCDNYFPFLGELAPVNRREIVQLWHATGAIKQFGYEDKTAQQRPAADQERFRRVYESFDYYIVGSASMADVFRRSYGAREKQMLYLGLPRTDYLVNQKVKEEENKQVILYLPTYREDNQEQTEEALDIKGLKDALGTGYRLIVKYHPHMTGIAKVEGLDDFVTYVEQETSSDQLIQRADVLITDYSSTAFDYALVHPKGKLVFFWPDEADYRATKGIQPAIETTFQRPICRTTEEVIQEITMDKEDGLEDFNAHWNTYNDGNATERVVEALQKIMDGK